MVEVKVVICICKGVELKVKARKRWRLVNI